MIGKCKSFTITQMWMRGFTLIHNFNKFQIFIYTYTKSTSKIMYTPNTKKILMYLERTAYLCISLPPTPCK